MRLPDTHTRAASLLPFNQTWDAILRAQWRKGLGKYGCTVEDNPLSAPEWAAHGLQEAADGAVYALRLSDTGHPIRGRLAALLFACAARVLLPVR